MMNKDIAFAIMLLVVALALIIEGGNNVYRV